MGEVVGVHAFIHGRVQGVGFRYFVVEEAQQRSFTGWVRNLDRGDVEVYAEGERVALESFLLILERGPRMAYVDHVTVEWQPATGNFNRFSIAPTDL